MSEFLMFVLDALGVVVLEGNEFADCIELTHEYSTLVDFNDLRKFFLNILY